MSELADKPDARTLRNDQFGGTYAPYAAPSTEVEASSGHASRASAVARNREPDARGARPDTHLPEAIQVLAAQPGVST